MAVVPRSDQHQTGRTRKLRATNADRRETADVLQMASREGRLDAAEFDRRAGAAETARYVDDLDALVADLPRQLGVRDWTADLRIRAADRDLATRWLTDALAEGRLTPEQHERRLADLAGAETYDDLRSLLDGVPGPPSATREELLVSAGDREAALDRLSQAFADGMLTADEHAKLRASAQRAARYRDLDRVAANLDGRVGTADRARVVRRLDQAHADGRLNAAEHTKRVRAANAATRADDLARLLDDLPGRTPARSMLSSVRRYRLSDAEREQAVRELQQALNDGRLTLDEYDERTRAAYAAQAARDLKPLLADLIEPEPSRRPVGIADPVENRPVGRRRVAIAAVVVGCFVLGGVGLAWHGRGDQQQRDTPHPVHALWSAPVDRPSTVTGVGNWVAGDTVIRARTDKVVAYQLADGRVSWTFQVPARQHVCAMSRTAEGGIGLIAYSPDGEYRCATLVALDVTNGRPLWQRERPMPKKSWDGWYAGSEEFALTTGTAVIKEPTGFLAVDPRENKQRWRLPAARGCEPYSVAAGDGVAALLSACEGRTARLTVADLASGRERWHAPLRISDSDEQHYRWSEKETVVLSLDPLVVRVSDESGRGGAFVSFDAHGARRATILQSQEEFDVAGSFPRAIMPATFEARWAYPVAVVGDTLVASVTRAGDETPGHVGAFSLTDGHRLWLTDIGYRLEALTVADGNILVKTGEELALLSPQDGRKVERHDLDEVLGERPLFDWIDELQAVGQRWVFLRVDGTKSDAPVMVLG